MNHSGHKLAYLSAVLNASIIGFSFMFTKLALDHASPIDMLAYRFAVSFAAMSIPVVWGKIRLIYRGKSIYRIFLLATAYPLGYFTLHTFGLQHAASSEGGILFAFIPVITMLLAYILLKEEITLRQMLSISLSVIGVVFIFMMKGSHLDWSNAAGISLLILSCLAFAVYSVLARSLLRTYSPAEISYVMLGIGFITFLLISLTGHAAAGTLSRLAAPLSSGTFLVSTLYLGVMSTLVTALTSNYALSRMEASRMSVFSNLSTVVSIAAGAIFLGENIQIYHLIGSTMIIAGIIGTNRAGKTRVTYENQLRS